MELELSDAEKVFIIHGIQDGLRNDGRNVEDFRPIYLETGLLSNTSGSARVRLGSTDILVGVKCELDTPDTSMPDQGRIQFSVDCSANATPEFAGRGGEELAGSLSSALATAYSAPSTFDLPKLGLVSGHFCWVIYVDVVLLECGGNLLDASSLAVKAALYNTRIPNVDIIYHEEKEEHDIELTDDYFDLWRPDVIGQGPQDYRKPKVHSTSDTQMDTDPDPQEEVKGHSAPILITVNRIGHSDFVDGTLEEEACVKSSLIVGVGSLGEVSLVRQQGPGSLDPESVGEMLVMGSRLGKKLDELLVMKLKEEETLEKAEICGFLA